LLCFHSNIQQMPLGERPAPPPELTGFCDLLAGWKLDSFPLIRYRARDPVYVLTAALRQKRPIRNGRLGENDGFDAMKKA
jgi:hypothetical protein